MDWLTQLWNYATTNHHFMPHGYCYFWNPYLVGLHVISDGLIAAAYASIPITLVFIVAKRRDLPFNWMFLLFGTFIISCGMTHVMGIITLWYAWYWLAGFVKVITAIASVGTAILLLKLIPGILDFPSRDSLLKANRELVRAEVKFRDLLEGVPDALVIIDDHNDINMVNQLTLELFGYKKTELLNQNIQILLPGINSDSRHPRVNVNNAPIYEYIAIHKNERSFPVDVRSSPVETGEERLTLMTIRDITERKRVEKMKDEFISVVSHELRTPLTSIYGSIEILLNEKLFSLSNEIINLLNVAKNNTKRLIGLINDILDIEKLELGKMHFKIHLVDINKCVEEAVAANKGFCDKLNIDIKFFRLSEDIKIHSDYDRLIQVLTNLISNAAKFSYKGGEICVMLSRPKAKIVRIAVKDKGKGIPENFKQNIFKKFTQADASASREHPGTGLGLHITKSIVEKLGGTIHFESKEGEGSNFYFDLYTDYVPHIEESFEEEIKET